MPPSPHHSDGERVERLEEERDTVLRRLNLKLGEGDSGREERERLKDIATALDCQPPAGQEEESWPVLNTWRYRDGEYIFVCAPGHTVEADSERTETETYYPASHAAVLSPEEARRVEMALAFVFCYRRQEGFEIAAEARDLKDRLRDYGKEHHAGH